MARGLIPWVGAAVLACVVIAFVYLQPNGSPPAGASFGSTPFARLGPVTAERARARTLAAEWQAVELQLRFADARRRLEPEFTRRRERELPSVALVVDGPDSVLPGAQPRLMAMLDSAWRELGLGTTKIAVGMVVDLWPGGRPGTRGMPFSSGAFLFPDSTDRSTCLASVALPNYSRNTTERLRSHLKASLGPCTWYARFGTPGARVRRWLGARSYDLALSSEWDTGRHAYWLTQWLRGENGRGWDWPAVYGFAPRTVGCLASRPAACMDAVRDGDGGGADGRLLVPASLWDVNRVRLVGGDRYLADVLRATGDDRFLDFWNTTLPIDTALAVALKAPVGDWTVRWQRELVPTLPLTPVLRPHELLPGLLLIGLAVALTVLLVRRREVG